MGYALGVDLGTTYSAAATVSDGRVEIFQLGDRASSMPSVVVLRDGGEVLVGDAAERRSLTEPTRAAREFKRRLGDPVPIVIGGTPYGADALLALLLRAIVQRVAQQMGEAPAGIAVTHPASYGPYKIDLLQQAIRSAEVGPVTLVTEPEAAAIHYANQERVPVGAVVAVYDFGGGTFDATLLRKAPEAFVQLGTPEGIERLGGIDFDQAILSHVDRTLGGALEALDTSDPRVGTALARLRDECRRAKESMSVDTDATIAVVLPDLQTEVRITRDEFEEMIRPRILETIAALQRAVRSAGLTFAQVDRILLVGGTSRIPLIGEMIRETTGRPVAIDVHPKDSVAAGAARIAASLVGGDRPSLPAGVVAPPVPPDGSAAALLLPLPAAASPDGRPPSIQVPLPAPRSQAQRRRGRGGSLYLALGVGLVILGLAAGGALALFRSGGAPSTPSPGPTLVASATQSPADTMASAAVSPNTEPSVGSGSPPAGATATIAPTVPSTPVPNPTRSPTPTPRRTPRPTRAPTPTPAPTPEPTPVNCKGVSGPPIDFLTLSTEVGQLSPDPGTAWCLEDITFYPDDGEGNVEVVTTQKGSLVTVAQPDDVCCDPVTFPLGRPVLVREGESVYRWTSCNPQCDNVVEIGYELVRTN